MSSLKEFQRRLGARKLQREYGAVYDHSSPPGGGNVGVYSWQIDFHNAGKDSPERCLIAANRVGKTMCAGAEVAAHATGEYPEWWDGKRFPKAVSVWTGGETNEASRDIIQLELLGPEGLHGTGWIPADSLIDVKYRQAGIPNVVDTIRVRHKSGGISSITLKTYEQGRTKWQGTSKHVIWLDEESPQDIYTEALTRILDVRGIILNTFTPLKGASDVVQHFTNGGPGIFLKNVTWDDAPHLDPDEKASLASSYPDWERDTRTKGIPMMGSGAVYPVGDDDIKCAPFEIPKHFYRIAGIDFGIDHPAAGVWIAWDKDADVIYVYDCYKKSGETAVYHTEAIKARKTWIPVSWPHDGMNKDKGNGRALWKQYRDHGVHMLKNSARYEDEHGGAQAIEPAVIEILERMKTGRFKVFSNCSAWFEEKRMYHRKDGKINPIKDDIMSATRYAVMMKRKAIPETLSGGFIVQHKYKKPILGRAS